MQIKQVQKGASRKPKSPATSRALTNSRRMQERRAFIKKVLAGKTDYGMSNAELEALDEYEPVQRNWVRITKP
jgi:hypothetical protein